MRNNIKVSSLPHPQLSSVSSLPHSPFRSGLASAFLSPATRSSSGFETPQPVAKRGSGDYWYFKRNYQSPLADEDLLGGSVPGKLKLQELYEFSFGDYDPAAV